ncbi:MAG TPA: Ig-like domain-containing protein [Longimicrobium sp.]
MLTETPPRSATRAIRGAHTPARLRAAAGALALWLTAACVDRTATGPELRPPTDAPGAVGALDCRVDVRAGTLECAPSAGAGGASAVILGGQGVNVRLRSTGMALDGPGTFRMDVTVENLIAQLLGTTDGVTPAAAGVRVFFLNGPTSSTGAVEVANPTGHAMFTAANQPYFQYQGLLAPGGTSEAMEWRFTVAPTVVTFQFQVLVAAPVPDEEGWLRMEPFITSLAVGESMPFHAHPYDAAGRPLPAAPITWSSSDTTVVRVAADGTVTGIQAGMALVFATDGVRTSRTLSVYVRVPAGDVLFPTAHTFTISPSRVNAGAADSVTVTVRLTDGGVGTSYFYVRLSSPSGAHETSCYGFDPVAGTPADGTYRCRAPVAPGVEGGLWRVTYFMVQDKGGKYLAISGTGGFMEQAGIPAYVYVNSPTPDLVKPTVTGLTFAPDSLQANGVDSAFVEFQVADGGTGVAETSAWFRNPSGSEVASCAATTPYTGTRASGTFRCGVVIPFNGEPGDWTLEVVRVFDATGNQREMSAAALDSAGYPTTLHVSAAPSDTVPPSLTGFSFTPDTVAADGLDSVTVSMELTDAASGAYRAEVYFRSPSNQMEEGCAAYTPELLHPGPQVITCRLAIPSGRQTGEWRVSFVGMRDAAGNEAFMGRAALQAMGYPISLTVTP